MKEGFELIYPYLPELKPLLLDRDISEIMVNNSEKVFVEKQGKVSPADGIAFDDPERLEVGIKTIARLLGDDISKEKPVLDSRLPDGSRVACVFPPCSVGGGINLTIRKFSGRLFTMSDLIRAGTLTSELAFLLEGIVEQKKNIIISGGTGTGKTTLLNVCCNCIPDDERLIVIEDTSEIQIHKPNQLRFESKQETWNAGPVTIRDLLRASLRHRPDRIILGEIRGQEAFDLLQALNTGHAGSLSTIHANAAEQVISRLSTCVLEAGLEMPYKSIKSNIADCVDIIVHLKREKTKRVVDEIIKVTHYNPDEDMVYYSKLYQRGGVYDS